MTMTKADQALFDALCDMCAKTRLMREMQKSYFKTRQQHFLDESKKSEREVDDALEEVAYAARFGERRPTQGDLFATDEFKPDTKEDAR